MGERPWTFPLLTFLLGAVFIGAVRSAHHGGFDEGVKQERAAKAEHDQFMRDLGTCDWAKIMAKSIKCEMQNKSEPAHD